MGSAQTMRLRMFASEADNVQVQVMSVPTGDQRGSVILSMQQDERAFSMATTAEEAAALGSLLLSQAALARGEPAIHHAPPDFMSNMGTLVVIISELEDVLRGWPANANWKHAQLEALRQWLLLRKEELYGHTDLSSQGQASGSD